MDPAIHDSNTFEFGGRRLRLGLNGSGASDQALDAIRRFVAERGTLPTAASWTHACMSPSEKTIRRRFGSFKAAVKSAGIDLCWRGFTGMTKDHVPTLLPEVHRHALKCL